MPFLDGLPVATVVNPTDVIALDQGGTTGVPGSAITRQATVQLLLGTGTGYLPLSGGEITGNLTVDGTLTVNTVLVLLNIPTATDGVPPSVPTGTVYSNGGVLCIA